VASEATRHLIEERGKEDWASEYGRMPRLIKEPESNLNLNVRSTERTKRAATLYVAWFAVWTLFGLVLFGQDFARSQRATPADDWRPLLFCWLTSERWGLIPKVCKEDSLGPRLPGL
jgi:hypothetical protein